MSVNISAYGLTLHLVASKTFPNGFTITEFADDQDAMDSPELTIADKAMSINGTLVVWQKPALIDLTLNVIPNSTADRNLSILADANRVSKSKGLVPMDVITITAVYQDGRTITLSNGIVDSAMFVNSAQSSGRLKTRSYKFAFEDRVETIPN